MTERDDRGRADAGLRRKALILGSILVLLALVVGSFFGDRGILHLVAQRGQAEALERSIASLKEENQRLAIEIQSLHTSPHAIERLAREQLGLAKPGETVFVIRNAEPGASR